MALPGSVVKVYYDDDTNEPKWITVNTGFLGTSENFVPLAGADGVDPATGGVCASGTVPVAGAVSATGGVPTGPMMPARASATT